MGGFRAESGTEVVDEPAEVEAVEHSELLSDVWGYRSVDSVDNQPCHRDRTFENRAGIFSVISTSFLTKPSVWAHWSGWLVRVIE